MKKALALVSLFISPALLWAKDYTISSPSGELSAIVKVEETTSLSIVAKGHTVMENCKISLTLSDGTELAVNSNVRKHTRGSRT